MYCLPAGRRHPNLNIMRQINLKSMVRTLVLAIVMLVAGTALAPQAQASKFRGIVGGHGGMELEYSQFGGGVSASLGVQAAKLFYIGIGVDYSNYGDNNLSFFANPRLDLFNVSKDWTPFASGRIGYQVCGAGNVYAGGDIGVRRSIGGSNGISLSIGVQTTGYWDGEYYGGEYYHKWHMPVALVTRLSFEF